jgi:hypothetical protein
VRFRSVELFFILTASAKTFIKNTIISVALPQSYVAARCSKKPTPRQTLTQFKD